MWLQHGQDVSGGEEHADGKCFCACCGTRNAGHVGVGTSSVSPRWICSGILHSRAGLGYTTHLIAASCAHGAALAGGAAVGQRLSDLRKVAPVLPEMTSAAAKAHKATAYQYRCVTLQAVHCLAWARPCAGRLWKLRLVPRDPLCPRALRAWQEASPDDSRDTLWMPAGRRRNCCVELSSTKGGKRVWTRLFCGLGICHCYCGRQ